MRGARSVPAARLLRHDLLVVRNGVADLLGSWRDRALIAVAVLIGAGWLAQARPVLAPAPGAALARRLP